MITGAVVGTALWIEHGHRIVIDAPAPADVAAMARAASCPENDTVPYGASCIAFLQGGSAPHWQWRINAASGGLPTYAPK
jgi:hypothetical protein